MKILGSKRYTTIFVIWLLLMPATVLMAQTTLVKGTVTDASSKEPIPYVSIVIVGTGKGAKTDSKGQFDISLDGPQTTLKFSSIGYKEVVKTVTPGVAQRLDVKLIVDAQVLNAVVVKGGKKPVYRNKDNPAVELIRQIIDHKSENRAESFPYLEYEQYEKMQFSLSNMSDKFAQRKIFKKYKFMFDNRDTITLPGKSLLPVYLVEKVSDKYYRKDPKKLKTVVKGEKKVDFGEYIDNQGLNAYFNNMYMDIDIYDNNISVVTNEFLSPIADGAPGFYKFFITDTISDQHTKLVELSFTPRNKTDMLFEGKLYVTLDGKYAVQKVRMTVNKNINLNWVRELHINLDFERGTDARYRLSKSDMLADFALLKKKGGGLFGQRTVSFKNYKVNESHPDAFYSGKDELVEEGADVRKDDFWLKNRHDTLSTAESKVYANVDSLKKMPSFKRTMELLTFLFAGYKSFGPFEVGPANTFYSFNPVEGFRLRLGGRTTPELSKRYYFETYGAYGFKDEKWKYFFSGTYSINNKSIYQFPQHYIRTSYQRDTKIPGQELQFVQEDNFLLSFKRGVNDKILYNDIWRLDYVHEYENHFSFSVGFKNWRQSPAGGLLYINEENGQPNQINRLTTSELSLELRYAPNEKFYQGKIYRVPIPGKYPVFTLRYTQGVKGLMNGEYNYQNISTNIYKRLYLSQLGYTDITLEGTWIFGQVPFPLMAIHRANQSYAYQLNSYNLMNFLEFVSDHYASINIDHSFNGFFLNKIPLIKKLKLREAVSLKMIYGGIRSENDPSIHPSLYQLPLNTDGIAATYSLGRQPYIEASVGLANIFKFFRVDLVKRLNYLDHPNVPSWGIRSRVKFDF